MLISFLFLDENICYRKCLTEALLMSTTSYVFRGASIEYPQHKFSSTNKKNIMWIPPLICSYASLLRQAFPNAKMDGRANLLKIVGGCILTLNLYKFSKWANSAKEKLVIFFFLFTQKTLHWRQFAWNVKSCFLGEIRKICQTDICWKNLSKVLSIKVLCKFAAEGFIEKIRLDLSSRQFTWNVKPYFFPLWKIMVCTLTV